MPQICAFPDLAHPGSCLLKEVTILPTKGDSQYMRIYSNLVSTYVSTHVPQRVHQTCTSNQYYLTDLSSLRT